jgi:hypothetical protein
MHNRWLQQPSLRTDKRLRASLPMRRLGEEVVGCASLATMEQLYRYEVLEVRYQKAEGAYLELHYHLSPQEDQEMCRYLMNLLDLRDSTFNEFMVSLGKDLPSYWRRSGAIFGLRRGGKIVLVGRIEEPRRKVETLSPEGPPKGYLLH